MSLVVLAAFGFACWFDLILVVLVGLLVGWLCCYVVVGVVVLLFGDLLLGV